MKRTEKRVSRRAREGAGARARGGRGGRAGAVRGSGAVRHGNLIRRQRSARLAGTANRLGHVGSAWLFGFPAPYTAPIRSLRALCSEPCVGDLVNRTRSRTALPHM